MNSIIAKLNPINFFLLTMYKKFIKWVHQKSSFLVATVHMNDSRLRQRITISLDREVLKLVSSIASENDVSIARVIRHAVDRFLKEWKEGSQEQLILPLVKKEGSSAG